MVYKAITIYSNFHQLQKVTFVQNSQKNVSAFIFRAPGIRWIL